MKRTPLYLIAHGDMDLEAIPSWHAFNMYVHYWDVLRMHYILGECKIECFNIGKNDLFHKSIHDYLK